MSDPYTPPDTEEELKEVSENVERAPLIGCVSGGCIVPVLLLVMAIISGDMGGPLLWPIMSVVFGFIGLVIGIIVKWAKL